MMGEIVIRNM